MSASGLNQSKASGRVADAARRQAKQELLVRRIDNLRPNPFTGFRKLRSSLAKAIDLDVELGTYG